MVIDLKDEIWKDIQDYEGMYQISNFGRVKSFRIDKTGKLMSIKTIKGYQGVEFKVNGEKKGFYIHRLVLENFKPVENMDLLEVNHKDENKLNNSLDNLEWVTHQFNINYGHRNQIAGEKMRGVNNRKSKKVRCIETEIIYNAFERQKEC